MIAQLASNLARTFISLVLVTVLAGCASRPQWPAQPAGDSQANLQQRWVLDSVPFYPQEKYQCGPASLAMMLNTRGFNTNPDVLKELVYLPEREGSLRVELVAGARSHGLLVYELDGSLAALLSEVAAGNPVLVMQNLELSWWPQWHFAVVIGFDRDERNIILHTDTREQHAESLEVFTATWNRADNWGAVMMAPDQLPVTADPISYLMAANDLETTGRTLTAMTAYQTAEAEWPEQPAAIMGQGNIAYARSDWPQAMGHFLRMTERFPTLAPGWHNLSQALGKAGCAKQANKAANCAAQLAPDRFQPTAGNNAVASGASNTLCPVIQCPAPASP